MESLESLDSGWELLDNPWDDNEDEDAPGTDARPTKSSNYLQVAESWLRSTPTELTTSIGVDRDDSLRKYLADSGSSIWQDEREFTSEQHTSPEKWDELEKTLTHFIGSVDNNNPVQQHNTGSSSTERPQSSWRNQQERDMERAVGADNPEPQNTREENEVTAASNLSISTASPWPCHSRPLGDINPCLPSIDMVNEIMADDPWAAGSIKMPHTPLFSQMDCPSKPVDIRPRGSAGVFAELTVEPHLSSTSGRGSTQDTHPPLSSSRVGSLVSHSATRRYDLPADMVRPRRVPNPCPCRTGPLSQRKGIGREEPEQCCRNTQRRKRRIYVDILAGPPKLNAPPLHKHVRQWQV